MNARAVDMSGGGYPCISPGCNGTGLGGGTGGTGGSAGPGSCSCDVPPEECSSSSSEIKNEITITANAYIFQDFFENDVHNGSSRLHALSFSCGIIIAKFKIDNIAFHAYDFWAFSYMITEDEWPYEAKGNLVTSGVHEWHASAIWYPRGKKAVFVLQGLEPEYTPPGGRIEVSLNLVNETDMRTDFYGTTRLEQ